jgi:transposase
MLTQKEKETLVIELYKQGANRREIAKKVHMSFSPISDIIKRFEGVESKEKNPLSKETKALKLFSKGKDLVYVATKLDMKHNLFGTTTVWITIRKSIRKCCWTLLKLSWEFLDSIGHFSVNQRTRSGGCN